MSTDTAREKCKAERASSSLPCLGDRRLSRSRTASVRLVPFFTTTVVDIGGLLRARLAGMTGGADRLGTVELGEFRLLAVLGVGAFGTVYLADQLGTGRRAVVKIAHAHLMQGSLRRHILGRHEAEVRAASRVRHPSLVEFYAAGRTSDGLPAMATEYVEGRTLGASLSASPSRAVLESVFRQLGEGVLALHQHGVVHRDLSPDNVMLETHGVDDVRVKIIDFGVAKLDSAISSDAHPLGTPRYMAPEQMRGEVGTAADVYSMGALLFFALAGREFLADLATPGELFVRVSMLSAPEGPRSVRSTVPPAEDQLVRDMLSGDPLERPSAGAFLERWNAICRSSWT